MYIFFCICVILIQFAILLHGALNYGHQSKIKQQDSF